MSGTEATMRALVLHAVGDARVERIPRKSPRAGDVLIRVGACGVCGSDIPRVFVRGTYRFPTVCGHEFAGTVETCGDGVNDLAPGTKVTAFPLLWCGRCAACEQGHYARCTNYDYLGSRSDGGFAEYVVAPRRNVLPLPANVSLEEGAMTEPAAVALHALRQAGCTAGELVAIFGAGPIGLMLAQWARALGAAQVALFDLLPEALALARKLGFELVFDPRQADSLDTVRKLSGGRGADVCIEAAGVPATMKAALSVAGNGGRVVLLGNPSADVTLPAPLISQAMRRELRVLGTWNSSYSPTGNNDDWHAVLTAMSAGTLQLKPLVTHRLSLEQAMDGMKVMRDRTQFVCKILIQP